MNNDFFEGKWMEMRGQIIDWWSKLTDDDLEQADGNTEQIVDFAPTKVWLFSPANQRRIQSVDKGYRVES